jgi:MoxR-like ATPase
MVVDERLRRMVRTAIASASGVLLVGPPGTGKSSLLAEVATEICSNPQNFGFGTAPLPAPLTVTAEEGWTSRELVGGESIVNGVVVFRPGHLLRAIDENRWLVIDEMNRADMDKIFGAVFTWLADVGSSRRVSLGRLSQHPGAADISLGWSDGTACQVVNRESFEHGTGSDPIAFLAGRSWRILGTYNAVDAQRVFRFGQALGRRFLRVPIPPINADEFETALAARAGDLGDVARAAIVNAYRAHLEAQSPDARLGPALFLRMADYVRKSQQLGGTESIDETLAEAYLVNVGPWLARLEESDLEDLHQRIDAFGALSAAQWTWITTMLANIA